MGAATPAVDPANVVQILVYTLLDVFDTARDLYQTLSIKEKRDYEQNLRAKGYPRSRRLEYVEDEELGSDEAIVMDKAAVLRQFDIGLQRLGTQFSVGDVITHAALQSQIIKLQGVLLKIFLYGPTSADPISHQLSRLTAASRIAGTSAVDILAAQLTQHQAELPRRPRSSHSPARPSAKESSSTSIVKYYAPRRPRSGSPVNTTVLDWRDKVQRDDADATSIAGPTSNGTSVPPQDLYCQYALDLQNHRDQELSSSITREASPFCPHCKHTLHLSPGKAWEVCKNDDGYERCFQVSNRFVVKCHRGGVDGQYTCVLCTRHASVHSVCGDVKALIRHIWEEHSIAELKHEEDITEVVELNLERRRDSGLGYSTSRGSRKSVGAARSRRGSKAAFETEVDVFEIRSAGRGG